ncbi:MAG: DUF2378 family protein [Myxococcaceae bacterium]
MSEKLVFAHTVEGLVRSVRDRLTPALISGLRERGIDVERRLLPAYPMEVFVDGVGWLSRQLYPELPADEAVAKVGRGFMDGFGQTLVGRAMMAMMRVIGPDASLRRITQEFRTGNNYSQTRLVVRAPRTYELWVNELRMPGWYVGIVSRGLELAGAKSGHVELVSRDTVGGTFRIEWS